MKTIAKLFPVFAFLAVFACLATKPMKANQFDIGNTASCPNSVNSTACPYIFPAGPGANEVIGINAGSLTMFNNGGHDISTDFSTFLLLIGIPNQTNLTATAPTISSVTANTGTIVHPPIQWSAPIYEGQLKGTAGTSVCDLLGFPNPDQGDCNSENFGNWSGAEAVSVAQGGPGITINNTIGFAIYEFQISGIDIPAVNPDAYLTVVFNGSGLAIGDFTTAYGCQTAPLPCKNDSSTPFTQSGLVTTQHQVPEPGGLVLIGSGLLMASFARRRSWL